MSIGERVRAGRKALHLSQEEVARRAGVSLNQVNRLERGEIVDPHFSTLAGLATALGMQISELVGEPAVPLGDAPQGSGQAETPKGPEEAPERTPEQRILDEFEYQFPDRAEVPEDLSERLHQVPQQWESALASVRERRREVAAKVDKLVEASVHSEVDPHEVKRALDEAQGFQFTLMRAMSGASLRHSPGRVGIVFNPFAPELDPAQWDEVGDAMRFYNDIVDRLVKAGLAEWKERAGQKRELVPVGSGA